MAYTKYIPSTMLNVTAIFIFSTVMLFNISGNDMIKIQEESIDEALSDFRLLIGFVNFNLTEEIKTHLLKKLSAKDRGDADEKANAKNTKSLWIATIMSTLLLVLTVVSFLLYGRDLTTGMIAYNVVVIMSLFVTEVYIYFEIIRMYKYNIKKRFYDQLFKHLLKDTDAKALKTYVCSKQQNSVHEENLVFY